MLSVIGLIIVLGLVVFVHELGHFAAARWAGVGVKAFSIGFGLGRPIFKWTDRRGTEWRIGWLPLGGYVELQEDTKDKKGRVKKFKDSLQSAPRWKRAIIMVAGVFMNFLLALVLYLFIFAARPEQIIKPVIGQVVPNSLAEKNGVQPGWEIARFADTEIAEWGEFLKAKAYAGGEVVKVEFTNGEIVRLVADQSWGVAPAIDANPQFKERTFFGVISRASSEVWEQSKMLFVVLRQIVLGERDPNQLGSFLTIAEISGNALAAGIFALLSIIAVLSINLGVINLLPIPALDGGQLLILAIEGLRRRKLSERAVNFVILAGWALLIFIMAFALKNDLVRAFGL